MKGIAKLIIIYILFAGCYFVVCFTDHKEPHRITESKRVINIDTIVKPQLVANEH